MDELRRFLAQLAVKEMLEVFVAPPFAKALVATQGVLKKLVEEAPVLEEARSVLGSQLSRGGGVESLADLRTWAMEFLGKFRAEVDRVICFGLGFRIKASRGLRRRMGWVFSRLGLKPKLQFGCKLRGRHILGSGRGLSGLKGSWIKAGSGQGKASTEFTLASPESIRLSPTTSSSVLATLEVAQSLSTMIDSFQFPPVNT